MRRSILNRFIAPLADHSLLSLLWLAACLPVVTAPLATAALFEVVRQRGAGDDPPLIRSFVAALRQYARPALLVGYGWAALGGFLALDLAVVAGLPVAGREVVLVALLVLAMLYALVSVALFPVLVSYHAPAHHLLRTAVVVALVRPAHGLAGLAVCAAAVTAVWLTPLAIVLAPGLAATAVWRLYEGTFDRLRAGVRVSPLVPVTKEILR